MPHWTRPARARSAGLLVVHGLIQAQARFPKSRVLDFLRHFYPVLLYTPFFVETGSLNRMFFPGYLDPVVAHWEQWVFGCQPSVLFMEKIPWLPVSELFYICYFSYYVMIGGVGIALFLRSRPQFFHYVSVVSFLFYGCYLMYIILPVIGVPALLSPGGRLLSARGNPAIGGDRHLSCVGAGRGLLLPDQTEFTRCSNAPAPPCRAVTSPWRSPRCSSRSATCAASASPT